MRPARPSRAFSAAILAAFGGALACSEPSPPGSPAPAPTVAPTPLSASAPSVAVSADVAASAAPPDLAADVVARTAAARARFGASARTDVVGGLFLLTEVGPRAQLFDQADALLTRALPRLQAGHFRTPPSEAVSVYLFSRADDYDAFSRKELGVPGKANMGAYRRSARDIALDGAGGAAFVPTLTHEAVHPLIEADFRGAPLWLDEGIASLFEAPVFDAKGDIHGVARNWRHARLQKALASLTERATVRLPALFGMSTRAFKAIPEGSYVSTSADTVALHYAMARSVCAWLDERGQLWPFYAAWRDGFAEDPTGEKAFARVAGGTPEAMSAGWEAWAR